MDSNQFWNFANPGRQLRLKIYHSSTLLLASINEIEIQANRSYSQHNIYTFKYMCWLRNLFIISSLPTPALRQEFCGTCGNWCPANADCGWVAIIQHVETWKSASPLNHNVHLITFDCHAAAQRLPTVISISLARSFFLFKEMKWKSLRERTPTCPADRILRHVAVYIYEKKKMPRPFNARRVGGGQRYYIIFVFSTWCVEMIWLLI